MTRKLKIEDPLALWRLQVRCARVAKAWAERIDERDIKEIHLGKPQPITTSVVDRWLDLLVTDITRQAIRQCHVPQELRAPDMFTGVDTWLELEPGDHSLLRQDADRSWLLSTQGAELLGSSPILELGEEYDPPMQTRCLAAAISWNEPEKKAVFRDELWEELDALWKAKNMTPPADSLQDLLRWPGVWWFRGGSYSPYIDVDGDGTVEPSQQSLRLKDAILAWVSMMEPEKLALWLPDPNLTN